MIIGCIKEIKRHEYRVGLTPHCVKEYVKAGHRVIIEKDAGKGASFKNRSYIESGAEVVDSREEVFSLSDMIVKVKEPQKEEYNLFKNNQILFTYLHLAADRELTMALLEKKVSSVAYETIQKPDGSLPCLKPMSEIAGRLSIQEGAKFLEKPMGGSGVLLGGVPGVKKGRVTILGGGVVGTNAARMAIGLGADVSILDINSNRLEYLDNLFFGKIQTLYSTRANILRSIKECDLLVGAVLIPGAKAPNLVSVDDLSSMKKGSVVVDVAVDQGGCIESTKPTTHDDPVFSVNGVINYCVANMPGAVSKTSTDALTSITLPYGLKIANMGLEKSCLNSRELLMGLNTYRGNIVCRPVADAFSLAWEEAEKLLDRSS